jgi:hypothetical protein
LENKMDEKLVTDCAFFLFLELIEEGDFVGID